MSRVKIILNRRFIMVKKSFGIVGNENNNDGRK
jgi:hypothetical protein